MTFLRFSQLNQSIPPGGSIQKHRKTISHGGSTHGFFPTKPWVFRHGFQRTAAGDLLPASAVPLRGGGRRRLLAAAAAAARDDGGTGDFVLQKFVMTYDDW